MPHAVVRHTVVSATVAGLRDGIMGAGGGILRRCESGALFLCAPLLFSANMVIARGMNGSLPPVTLAFGRWMVAALLLLPIVWPVLRRGGLSRASALRLAVPALLGGALSVAPQYAAASFTSAGHIALVFALTPLLVALIERVGWKAPLRRRTLAGVVLAFLGIGVSTFEGDPSRLIHLQLNAGDMLAFAAALAWAAYTALLRHRPVVLPPLTFLWGIAAGGALALAPAMAVEWRLAGVPAMSLHALAGVAALAVIAGIGAYLVYNRVVGRLGPATASMSMYLVPVYALTLGALVLGETLAPYHGVAVALVLGGVAGATLNSGVPAEHQARGRAADAARDRAHGGRPSNSRPSIAATVPTAAATKGDRPGEKGWRRHATGPRISISGTGRISRATAASKVAVPLPNGPRGSAG